MNIPGGKNPHAVSRLTREALAESRRLGAGTGRPDATSHPSRSGAVSRLWQPSATRMTAPKTAALPLVFALLAGCAAPTPAPVLLTLPAVTTNAAAPDSPGAAEARPLLAVRRVGIPEYLVARRVRYRADPATLAEWPNTYWAERIEIGVSREFVAALRQQLPGWGICDTSCTDQQAALNLQVDLAPMDFLRGAKKLQGRARISVSGNGVPLKVLASREIGYDIPASGDSAQSQAETIAALIQQVAADTAPLVRSLKP